ncbi:hypothetical protein HPB47_008024 [Ixodes persulcatus]|uniref:Uncharacterized protein n=1 Tax=Ixodes persulcatus TaxID=34615 RepID=A0AC60P6B3_IXOPE|nr:hypothetical protein HPB47_008024 [Ixodes persulcatus]
MRRQDPGNDYYTPDISLKSRGDFYGNVHDDDDDDVADGARKHTKSWATDKYDVFSPVWRSSKYRQSTTFESHARSYGAHRAKEQWMPPYLVYRGKIEESLTPQTAKNVCGSLNKNKANAKAVGDAIERAVLSESSYYGDTSLEALSVLRKEDASNGRQAASGRRRRSNDAGKNPVESETLAASSAIQTGANKVHERSAQKLDYPRFDDQSCKKDALEIEGLMPGDVDMNVLEKVAGPRYRGSNIPQQNEGDIVQAHRDDRMLGAVAPPFTSGLDAESEDGIHVLKALERLNQQLLDDKPRTSSLSSEQVVVEQRTSEQRSSRPNGKRVPVSQEPLIVPASAATAKAMKPMRRTLSDQDVTPTQGMVTGLKYPCGRTSYEESKPRESRRNGHGRRPDTDDSTVEVHEGFVVTDDEIKLLLAESNDKHKGKISDPKVPPRQSTTISSKLHRHDAERGHHEFEHDSCQDEYRNDSHFRARNREYDVQPEIQSDTTPRSEGRQFNWNGSVPRDSRHGRLKSEVNAPNRWRHCHHLRESATYVERRSGQSIDSRRERNWKEVIEDNDDDDDGKSHRVSRKQRVEVPPEDHSEHLKGGRLLREATKTTRILQSSEELDYSVDSDEDDDESTMNGDAGNWSFVSSRSSKDGVFGRGQIRIEKGEGTTGFSLGSSTWYTPEASSTSSGVQPAVLGLDDPVIGNWRKKSNIVLRRTLRFLFTTFGGRMNPDEPLREDLGSAVFRYLPEEDTWELCGHMPQAKSYHASVAVEDSVYIIGGYTLESTFDAEPSASASCFRLDVLAMSWETVAPLNRARACHVAVTAQGRIYVAGGKDKKGRITDAVESYDVATGRWEHLPNLPRPLMASAAAYFQASFWVLGGVTRSKSSDCRVTDAVYQFDFTDGRWFHSVDLWTPVAYSLAFTTESGGRLWLWGGVTEDGRSLGELRCWSPEHRAWKHCCRLNPPRHGFCGAIGGNQVSIFGGIDSERGVATDAHNQLNVSDQTIRAARPLPCPLAGASALAFSGYRRSPSVKSLRSEAESDDDEPKLKLRTVYRRYRQRRKLRDRESDLDPRELKCAQGVVRSDSYQILAPAVDPNLGLALVLQDEEKTYSAKCSDTLLAIKSIRPCKNLFSASTSSILSFGGIDLHRPSCHEIGRLALYFHPLKNGWELLEMMPEPRNYHTASLVGDEVFVIGGCDPHKTRSDEAVSSESVFCYSAARRSWSKRTDLPEARSFHGAAVLDDKIYVVGGRDQRGRYLDTVVEYSPMADGWSTVLRLPRCVMGSSVVSMDRRLWVLGGVSSPADSSFQPGPDDLLDDVFVLDVAHRTYTAGPPLPFPCAFAAATVTKRMLWFCGGLSPNDKGKLKSVSSTYVLEEGSWKFYDVLALNKHAFPAISFADSFVLSFGGATTSYEGSVDDCEIFYDGPGHGVLRLRPPPFPLAGHACVALPPVPLGHSKTDPPDVVDMWQRMCEGAKAL